MGPKFFVYADNAWREVDTSTGRIDGWRGRAKFVYARRGRLHVAKSRSVLHALSALAAGEHSAVRDGPRLSQLRCPESHKLKALPELCNGQHSCCEPVKWNPNKDKEIVPIVNVPKVNSSSRHNKKVDVSIQVDGTPPKNRPERCDIRINLVPVPRRPQNHERSRSEFGETEQREKRARNSQKLNNSKEDQRCSRSTDGSSSEFTTRPVDIKREPPILRSSKQSLNENVINIGSDSSTDEFKDRVNSRKRKLRKSSHNKTPAKKKKLESTEESSDVFEPSPKSETVAIVHKEDTTTDDTNSEIIRKITRANLKVSKRRSSSSDFVPKTSSRKVQISSRTRNRTEHSNENIIRRQIEAYNFLRRPAGVKSRTACLELVIPEEDVSVLREFVVRTDCADLEKFDADDDYKRMLFYAINPLVDIEKCSQIERLLETNQLKRFAKRLGLCSISDVSSQRSTYNTRNRTRQANVASDSDSETNNDTRPPRKSNGTEKSFSHKANDTRDELKNGVEISRNDTNESIGKSDRERYKGRYVKEALWKAIARISKYNVERLNRTEGNEINRVKIQDRLEQTADNVSKDITRTVKQILKRDKYGKFLSERAKEVSRKPNSVKSDEVRENTKNDRYDRERRILKSSRITGKNQNKKQDESKSEESTKSSDRNPDILKKIHNDKSRSTRRHNLERSKDRDNLERSKDARDKSKSKKMTVASKENVPESENRLRDNHAKKSQETVDSIAVDSSLGTDLEKTGLSNLKSSHVISKRATYLGKEYSNLEDHAIVAYISHGSRASHVNGNKLWRELEERYFNITNIKRSWHSLRNRYLRYILPRLGALRLPPSQESRLRAAAATGWIKTKSRNPERRNSIFCKEAPQRGASDRRLRHEKVTTTPDDTQEMETSPPAAEQLPVPLDASRVSDEVLSPRRPLRSNKRASKRSPRYSDVTRQFASRKLRSTPRDTPQTPQKPDSPLKTRTRKLFNPRKEL